MRESEKKWREEEKIRYKNYHYILLDFYKEKDVYDEEIQGNLQDKFISAIKNYKYITGIPVKGYLKYCLRMALGQYYSNKKRDNETKIENYKVYFYNSEYYFFDKIEFDKEEIIKMIGKNATDKQGKYIYIKYWLELSNKEIIKIMNCNVQNIYKKFNRFRNKIVNRYKVEDFIIT